MRKIRSVRLTVSSTERSRQNSAANSPIAFSPPRRAETSSSLPPYSPPRLNWGQEQFDQRPRAPADILNLCCHHTEERSGKELDSGKFKFLVEPDIAENETFESPESSPIALRASKAFVEEPELDGDVLKPLESRKGTESEVAIGSPDPLGIYASTSATRNVLSRSVTDPSPYASFQKPSLIVKTEDARRDPSMAWELTTLEGKMDELKGVKMCVLERSSSKLTLTPCASSFYKSKSRISYPVTRIESMRDSQTRRRYIVIKPPTSSNIEFYLCRSCSPAIMTALTLQSLDLNGSCPTANIQKLMDLPMTTESSSSSRVF